MLAGRQEDPFVALGSVPGKRGKGENEREQKNGKDLFHSYLLIYID
jgi:hypothetical protein